MATAITIHGGSGADTINYSFVVTGTSTTRFAEQFAGTVNALLLGGDPLTLVHSSGGDARLPEQGAQAHIYDLIPSTVNGGSNVFNIFNAGYVIDSVSGGAQLNLAGGDTVIVAGQNSQTTVTSANAGVAGNNDVIVFVSGNNEYIGDTTAGAGNGEGHHPVRMSARAQWRAMVGGDQNPPVAVPRLAMPGVSALPLREAVAGGAR